MHLFFRTELLKTQKKNHHKKNPKEHNPQQQQQKSNNPFIHCTAVLTRTRDQQSAVAGIAVCFQMPLDMLGGHSERDWTWP